MIAAMLSQRTKMLKNMRVRSGKADIEHLIRRLKVESNREVLQKM